MNRRLALYTIAFAGARAQQPARWRPPLQKYLEDPVFRWKLLRLPHFDLRFPQGMPPAAAASAGRDAERLLLAQLHFASAEEYTPRIHLFLVESYDRVRQLMGYYAAGASQPDVHIVCFAHGHPESLAHELNHEVMTHLWGASEPWIAEGLAAYVSEPEDVDIQMRRLRESRKSVPLTVLVNPAWSAAAPYPSTVIYPELGSFVKYLKTTHGMATLHRLWRGGSRALRPVLGKSLLALEQDWLDKLAGR